MKNDIKIAFTGASGSGKTTLVKWVSEEFGIPHISGSAGDIKTTSDNYLLNRLFNLDSDGHHGVIVNSAINPYYGVMNQKLLLMRRVEMFRSNPHFVTDRSTIDNMTYFINQCSFHPEIDTQICLDFFKECVAGLKELDLVIHILSVQPDGEVENNGSRIHNQFYQNSIDSQFTYWGLRMMRVARGLNPTGSSNIPLHLVIDFWDLEARKESVGEAIQNILARA